MRRGFTVVEALVAGIILALAVAVIGTSLSQAYGSLADARDERRAAALLDELLTKIDMLGPARIAAEGPRSGNFQTPDDRFSWSAEIRNRPQGHLYDVTVTISWPVANHNRSVQVQTYLNDQPKSRNALLKWDDL
jgi:type II secretory pathway pseudopilin PulG